MSESNFTARLNTSLASHPMTLIIEERLKVAESLLKNKDKPKEAYVSSGFNSFSYFSRIFKMKHNMSPTTYKMQASLNETQISEWVWVPSRNDLK